MIRLRQVLFVIFILLIGVSYFNRDSYKSIDSVLPETFQAPTQVSIKDGQTIQFVKDGYDYTLAPLYDYTLNGLVLHQQKYDAWYSLSRTDKIFIKDVCMIWGKTLENGSYTKDSVSIKQDSRWCWWRGTSDIIVNNNEFSNNHLIASNPDVVKQILSIGGGDQVRIVGKLVNVLAVTNGKTNKYEYDKATWLTSTTRDDTGGGACEIIYVESIEILKKGNLIYRFLFLVGLYGFLVCIFWWVVELVINVRNLSAKIVDVNFPHPRG